MLVSPSERCEPVLVSPSEGREPMLVTFSRMYISVGHSTGTTVSLGGERLSRIDLEF